MNNNVYVNKDGIVKDIIQPLKIELKVIRSNYSVWTLFKNHHYLSNELNKSARVFVAFWNNLPVACVCVLPQPSGWYKNGWRVSRLVVLPDYQGLGIGSKLLKYIATLVKGIEGESHLFIRMMHPSLIKFCLSNNNEWVETSHSKKLEEKSKGFTNYKVDTRVCYAFEYIGEGNFKDSNLFYQSFSETNDLKEEYNNLQLDLFG